MHGQENRPLWRRERPPAAPCTGVTGVQSLERGSGPPTASAKRPVSHTRGRRAGALSRPPPAPPPARRSRAASRDVVPADATPACPRRPAVRGGGGHRPAAATPPPAPATGAHGWRNRHPTRALPLGSAPCRDRDSERQPCPTARAHVGQRVVVWVRAQPREAALCRGVGIFRALLLTGTHSGGELAAVRRRGTGAPRASLRYGVATLVWSPCVGTRCGHPAAAVGEAGRIATRLPLQ